MLRWHVHQLRKALADDRRVLRNPYGYQLVVEPDELDADRFERLCGEARCHLDEGGGATEASTLLHRALALWRGPAYSDVAGRVDASVIDDEVARLDQLHLAALQLQVEADLRLGQHDVVAVQLRSLVAEYPLREAFRAQLMLALYRAGRQAEALEVYHDARRLMIDELGIDPSPELRHMEQAILAGDPSLDLTAPPIQVEPAPLPVPAELPIVPPEFTGREAETNRLSALITGTNPVVVIYGPGGIGKSATAVHLGHRLAGEYPDGQLYANLHGSTPGGNAIEPREVLPRFLRSLGADGPSLAGANVDELAAVFRSTIAAKRILIVLDDAASTSQIWPLLPGTTNCAVILTTRRALSAGLPHFRMSPLPESDAKALLERLAGDERATGSPESVAEISRLCDRLPLALCVSGARLVARPTWSWEKLAERLRDERRRLDELMDGDRAVRASFAVSYHDLRQRPLGAEAARVFRLIGLVDVTDLGITAAAAVTGHSLPQTEVLLDALVDAQLMENDSPGRYHMHGLLRLFARECADNEEAPRDRTAALVRAFEFYLATARRATRIVEPMSQWWLDCEPLSLSQAGAELSTLADVCAWVDVERDNLIAAVKQAADFPAGGPAIAVSLTAALLSPLGHTGRGLEQAGLSLIASDVAPATGDPAHLAIAAYISGLVLHAHSPEEAVANLCAARDLWHELGHRRGEAAALRHLGTTCGSLGSYELALECVESSLKLARQIGNPYDEASCLGHQGLAYQRLGRKTDAIAAHGRSLQIYRKLGHRSGEVVAAGCLATAIHVFGDLDPALVAYEQALELAREYGHRLVEAECLWGRAEIFHQLGDRVRARESRRLSVDLLAELGWIGHEEKAAIVANPRPPVPAGFWTNI